MLAAKMLVDSAVGFIYLSMLDGYSGYNQIFIANEDVSKTVFRCLWALGTYKWIVMPLCLKKTGATYQGVMNSIFHDYIKTFVQVYIGDIVIKYASGNGHLNHLRQSFERMRRYRLKMKPLKCSFWVQTGDFLTFVMHKKRIEINQNKTKAIMETRPRSTKKELQSLLRKINFLRRFISNLSGKTQAFLSLLQLKKERVECQEEHQMAFDEIKEYLMYLWYCILLLDICAWDCTFLHQTRPYGVCWLKRMIMVSNEPFITLVECWMMQRLGITL